MLQELSFKRNYNTDAKRIQLLVVTHSIQFISWQFSYAVKLKWEAFNSMYVNDFNKCRVECLFVRQCLSIIFLPLQDLSRYQALHISLTAVIDR